MLAGCILPLPDPDPAIDPHRQRHIQQAHHPELVTSLAPLATGRLSIHYSRSSARNPPSRPRSPLRPCSNTPTALRGHRRRGRCHPRTPATVARHTLCRRLGCQCQFSRRSARVAFYGCYLASPKPVYRRVASCGFAGKLLGLPRTPAHARPERASLHFLISTTQSKLLSIIEGCTFLPSLRLNHNHGLSIVPRVNELSGLEPEAMLGYPSQNRTLAPHSRRPRGEKRRKAGLPVSTQISIMILHRRSICTRSFIS